MRCAELPRPPPCSCKIRQRTDVQRARGLQRKIAMTCSDLVKGLTKGPHAFWSHSSWPIFLWTLQGYMDSFFPQQKRFNYSQLFTRKGSEPSGGYQGDCTENKQTSLQSSWAFLESSVTDKSPVIPGDDFCLFCWEWRYSEGKMSQDNPPALSGVWSGSHLKLSLPAVKQPGLWLNFAYRKHWVLRVHGHYHRDSWI